MLELLVYYVIVSVLFVGAPGVFFFIVFMPALQNTKGRIVGYREYQKFGPSTINTPLRSKKWLQSLEPEERVLE